MIRRPPRSTQSRSSAASDVYKRQILDRALLEKIYELDADEIEKYLVEYEEKISKGEYCLLYTSPSPRDS